MPIDLKVNRAFRFFGLDLNASRQDIERVYRQTILNMDPNKLRGPRPHEEVKQTKKMYRRLLRFWRKKRAQRHSTSFDDATNALCFNIRRATDEMYNIICAAVEINDQDNSPGNPTNVLCGFQHSTMIQNDGPVSSLSQQPDESKEEDFANQDEQ